MTDPSIALRACEWADHPDTRRRVAMILSQEAAKGAAVLPEGDLLAAVINMRWTWAREWGTVDAVTDGQIRDSVHRVWSADG